VDYGVHLPLISLKGQRHWSLRGLLEYAEIAERLGFRTISANRMCGEACSLPSCRSPTYLLVAGGERVAPAGALSGARRSSCHIDSTDC
jgi:hypothetical protein